MCPRTRPVWPCRSRRLNYPCLSRTPLRPLLSHRPCCPLRRYHTLCVLINRRRRSRLILTRLPPQPVGLLLRSFIEERVAQL